MLSVMGQHKFYAALSNFLGIIGYWTGDFRTLAAVNQKVDHLCISSGMGVCDLC